MCQCIPVVRSSNTCMRYMPTFPAPVTGSTVCTMGSVTKRPPSAGQHLSTGRISSDASSPVRTTCWHAPRPRSRLGNQRAASPNRGRVPIFSARLPLGDMAASANRPMRSGSSSSEAAPRANAMRRSEPKRFIATGKGVPVFSKSSALPPCFTTRSAISAISSTGFTKVFTRTSSPSLSSRSIYSRKLPYINFLLLNSFRRMLLQQPGPQPPEPRRRRPSYPRENGPPPIVRPAGISGKDSKLRQLLRHRDPIRNDAPDDASGYPTAACERTAGKEATTASVPGRGTQPTGNIGHSAHDLTPDPSPYQKIYNFVG